jgi:tight adherence protein B
VSTVAQAAVPLDVLAVVCAGAAAALLWPASGRAGAGGDPPVVRRRAAALVPWLGLGLLGAVWVGTPQRAALVVIVAVAGWAGATLLRRRRAARAGQDTSVRLLEACEQLTGELAAGQPPSAALEHCAGQWPLLTPVAEAFRVGADVPAAWREVARRPGADDLRLVAAAWQVSHRTGAGLAGALEHVTADLRARHATRRVVAGELASARATARLMAVLPLGALTLGSGTGGDPWGFLLGHPVGLACLALGLGFALAGLTWIESLARQVDRP